MGVIVSKSEIRPNVRYLLIGMVLLGGSNRKKNQQIASMTVIIVAIIVTIMGIVVFVSKLVGN